jgi:hypothetical protein
MPQVTVSQKTFDALKALEDVDVSKEKTSRARRRMTPEELEASYRAMAADEEGEAEAREWVNAYLGEDLPDDEAR